MQNDYKHSMNGWLQVITGLEFNCTTATEEEEEVGKEHKNQK